MPLLTLLILIPCLGAAVVAFAPARHARLLSLVLSLSTIAGAAWLILASSPWPRVETSESFTLLGSQTHLECDELSLLLVLLTGLITPACLIAAWKLEPASRAFRALFLLLQGSVLGVFLTRDWLLWFLFWELSLVPAFFLVKLWGGPAARQTAFQFFVFTMGGSVFLLLGLVGSLVGDTSEPGSGWSTAIFVGILLGFAVKAPLFPFHTWMAPTYAEAPTPVSMFLTAVMSKMGVYGILRFLAFGFPTQMAALAPVLTALALGGVIVGAFAALAQRDLKRMLAYSSFNHVSYCLLALFAAYLPGGDPAAAMPGVMLQMFNHGLSAAALFFLVGVLEERSGGRRGLHDFGGVRTAAPLLAGLSGVALFSSLGLPGLNGFVGEFLIFVSVFASAPWAAALGCLALLATALFLLTFYQRVFHGPTGPGVSGFRDLDRREVAVIAPAIVLMFVLGFYPQLLLQLVNGWLLPSP